MKALNKVVPKLYQVRVDARARRAGAARVHELFARAAPGDYVQLDVFAEAVPIGDPALAALERGAAAHAPGGDAVTRAQKCSAVDSTRAPLGERVSNMLLGYWRYIRKEGRVTTNVIVFMLLSAALIVYLIFEIFAVQPHYELSGDVRASPGGVFTGQEVTYRGVTVGRVGSAEGRPGRASASRW